MPRGVSDQFLHTLRHERTASLRAAVTMTALVPLGYFMAELTDAPAAGAVVAGFAVALAAGLALGLAWGAWRTRTYNESLRGAWNAWMRMSTGAARVHDLARAVADKSRRPPLSGVGWGVLLVANAALFASLWAGAAWASTYGAALAAVNGGTLGALAGRGLWTARWTTRLRGAVDELVAEGQLGAWGER